MKLPFKMEDFNRALVDAGLIYEEKIEEKVSWFVRAKWYAAFMCAISIGGMIGVWLAS